MCKPKKNISFKHDSKKVNRNFRIKVYGQGVNTLVGVSGLLNLIGVKLANTLLENAFDCPSDVYIRNLRRGLRISFYWK